MGIPELLFVALGGAVGACTRYALIETVNRNRDKAAPQSKHFPLGTIVVNVIGSFLIGLLAGIFPVANSSARLLLVTGLCGGLTTFSTASVDTVTLTDHGGVQQSQWYTLANLLLSLAAVTLGLAISG